MGSEQNRFLQQERRKKWGGCWGGLSCFKVQKSARRIVPASRTPDGSTGANQPNGPQGVGLAAQTTSIPPHLLAPPSSPASFSNSGLPSTAQSPSCHLSLSANSPGGPSSTMYATGPYANDTRLVTPPVLSTFTTEPSTAPVTPPPELAHLTTPSSPEVPYAQFLSSSADFKYVGKANYGASNDLRMTYPLSPRSPAGSLTSPVSRTSGDCLSSFPEREPRSPWDPSLSHKSAKYSRSGSGRLAANGSNSKDSNFFCPATFAQFYLDQPHSGGRLSVSKDSDAYSNAGTVNQSKQNKNNKQDVEELEAYRASFGFSADEMITTSQYVEISDVVDDSFTMMPCTSNKPQLEETGFMGWGYGRSRSKKTENNSPCIKSQNSGSDVSGKGISGHIASDQYEDDRSDGHAGDISGQSTPSNFTLTDEEDIFSDTGRLRNNRKYRTGLSCSDAEIEYRRGRSLRECRGDLSWH